MALRSGLEDQRLLASDVEQLEHWVQLAIAQDQQDVDILHAAISYQALQEILLTHGQLKCSK